MRPVFCIVTIVVLLAASAGMAAASGSADSGRAATATMETDRVLEAMTVFQALMSVPEREVPTALMKSTQAVAIFPRVRRAGFIIGGERGKGVIVARDAQGGWSLPVFVSITGASIGWQAGIQSADIVLFFRTRDSVQRVLQGRYTLGVDASLAAGSLGRSAAAVTDADLTAEIYSYARARGVFAGLAVQGAAVDVDGAAADAFYQRPGLTAQAVLSGAGLPVPPAAAQLRRMLEDYQKAAP